MRRISSYKGGFYIDEPTAYGGSLLKTRLGRSRARPLATRYTMHLVLRSAKAKGSWSFKQSRNEKKILDIIGRFSAKYGVRVLSLANVGNHLHFQIKLTNLEHYKRFIRAITAAIAMAVTGTSRWKPLKNDAKVRFWDYRPFTRIVQSLKAMLRLSDYIKLNELEGSGYERDHARWIINQSKTRLESG